MRRIIALASHSPMILATAVALSVFGGCTVTPRQYWEALKGEGFPGWSDSGLRGNTNDVKPSGFFTDRRSEQIEKSLGGGF